MKRVRIAKNILALFVILSFLVLAACSKTEPVASAESSDDVITRMLNVACEPNRGYLDAYTYDVAASEYKGGKHYVKGEDLDTIFNIVNDDLDPKQNMHIAINGLQDEIDAYKAMDEVELEELTERIGYIMDIDPDSDNVYLLRSPVVYVDGEATAGRVFWGKRFGETPDEVQLIIVYRFSDLEKIFSKEEIDVSGLYNEYAANEQFPLETALDKLGYKFEETPISDKDLPGEVFIVSG